MVIIWLIMVNTVNMDNNDYIRGYYIGIIHVVDRRYFDIGHRI